MADWTRGECGERGRGRGSARRTPPSGAACWEGRRRPRSEWGPGTPLPPGALFAPAQWGVAELPGPEGLRDREWRPDAHPPPWGVGTRTVPGPRPRSRVTLRRLGLGTWCSSRALPSGGHRPLSCWGALLSGFLLLLVAASGLSSQGVPAEALPLALALLLPSGPARPYCAARTAHAPEGGAVEGAQTCQTGRPTVPVTEPFGLVHWGVPAHPGLTCRWDRCSRRLSRGAKSRHQALG